VVSRWRGITATAASTTSFDGDGKVRTLIGASTARLEALAIQADGRIVAAGYSWNGTNNDIALARYNVNGSLDTTFDTDGKLTTPIGTGSDIANSVVIQADGKIVVGGYSLIGAYNVFALVRYNVDGSLDTSFDGDGIVTTSIGTSALIRGLALQSDQKIVAAGNSWGRASTVSHWRDTTSMDLLIIRLTVTVRSRLKLAARMKHMVSPFSWTGKLSPPAVP